ncbi:FecR family protein [Cyclobacterium sp.]|uniref:FecR family protein n=1 Tax=Cyclobacterium sp. TaxID=1966343 RepID=UPI00198475B8|nr:FecR family protein [Cyclobacterium sp.]MBD3628828.1 FecR family protein [Cyclobacterium sp.]
MKDFIQKWKKFHKGKLSRSDAASFLAYLNSPEGKSDFQQMLKMIWEAENKADQANLRSSPNHPVLKVSSRQKKTGSLSQQNNRKVRHVFTWIRYTACLVAILMIAKEWGIFKNWPQGQEDPPPVKETAWITKSNPKGVKSKILLPDSSWVFLNADSRIRYIRDFAKNRKVILTGEAFFDVKKKAGLPFYVQAGQVTATVLGTSFNINTEYLESIEIALATGKIRILNEQTGKDILLQPGKAGKISKNTQSMEIIDVDPDKISLWKEGILHFEKEPFQLVIKKLENWYGVSISVEGELPNDLCTGTFQRKAYLSDVLKVLGHALQFDYDLNGKNVAIYPLSSG